LPLRFRLTPYARLALSLGLLILVGWGVLMIPGMARGRALSWVDGLFTSTSAVCVTGLVVRSTGNDFSALGQLAILLMIQVGGLGFMTLSSSVLMHIRQKVSLGEAAVMRESLGLSPGTDLPRLLLRCLRMVAVVEGAGAVLLFARFQMQVPEGQGWLEHVPRAAWAAVFHSVSAFCNAGFSIWDTSFTAYANDWFVNLVMAGLIVLGGLGFLVLVDLETWGRALRSKRRHRLGFQSQVVLTTTLGLILGGAILIWLGERMNPATLSEKPFSTQVLLPFFQSVTARTAGFNTVDMRDLSVFSLAVLAVLMFIGASPGSCGGGIKTTTFAVLMTLAVGAFRYGREPSFRHRAFTRFAIRSAVALFFAAWAIVMCGGFFLVAVEEGSVPLEKAGPVFLKLMFEATSAFGTVGLSTGITPSLSTAGKLCLVVLMFVGRVGPLGLISASLRGGARPEIRYPQENIHIG